MTAKRYDPLRTVLSELEAAEAAHSQAIKAHLDYKSPTSAPTAVWNEVEEAKAALWREVQRAEAVVQVARTHVLDRFRITFRVKVDALDG